MKRIKISIFILSVIVLQSSCKIQQTIQPSEIVGVFIGVSKELKNFRQKFTLELNQDKTFLFKIEMKDARPQCKGEWTMKEDSITLCCYEVVNIVESITNGYMTPRINSIKILGLRKLKYENVILKKRSK